MSTTSTTDKAYCRLCAKIKSMEKLVNLTNDTETRDVIVSKLNKFYINIDFTTCDDELPSTVCLTCVSSLNNACDFISTIQKAQEILKEELLDIKKEDLSDPDDVADLDDQDIGNAKIQIKEESYEVEIGPTEIIELNTDDTKAVSITDNIPVSLQKLTWEDYKWQCAFCDSQFSSVGELKTHSIQLHKRCNAFKCTECHMRISRIEKFLGHVRNAHRHYLRLSCHICYKKYSRPSENTLHKKLHIKTKFFCLGCHESFESSAELRKHNKAYKKYFIKKGSIEVDDAFICSVCQKTFTRRAALESHMQLHTGRQKFPCEKCGKGYSSKSKLRFHVLVVHEGQRRHHCKICNSKFGTNAELRNHVGIHGSDKPFECDECGKRFRLLSYLRNHSAVHTDNFRYICSYCDKGFNFRSKLSQHLLQHTGVRPYKCEKCDRSFTNWPDFNKHMKRMHKEDMARRRRTPKGLVPIDPKTGELIHYEISDKLEEWKKEVQIPKTGGRKKAKE